MTDLNLPDVRGESPSTRRNFATLKRWVEAYVAAAASGVTDHGALTGLSDDDHPQYHNDARGDARYAQLANDLSDMDAATMRTNLGLGSLAMLSAVSSSDIVDGTIVNADINASAAIADTKLATISTADKVAVSAIDINGATDIGAALVDADLIVVDDGAGGTNRKSALSRVATWLFAKVSGDVTINSTGTATIANDAVTNARMANMAAATIKGRASGAGTGDPTDLTATQVKTILGVGATSKVLVTIGTAAASASLTTSTAAADITGCTSGSLSLIAGDIVEIHGVFDAQHSTAAITMVGTLDINGVEQSAQALQKSDGAGDRATVAQQWLYTVPSTTLYTFKLRGRHSSGAPTGTFSNTHSTIMWKVYR